MHSFQSTIYKHRPFQRCCWGPPPIPTDVVGAPTQAAASPPALAPFCFFRLKAFPAPQKIPWPAYRAAWKCQGVNIPRATLTQWRQEGKYPNFSIPWWDSLNAYVIPQMASEVVREALTCAPLSVSFPLPLPPASWNHLPNKQPAPKSLFQGLLYTMVLFQCVCNKTYTKYTFKRIR